MIPLSQLNLLPREAFVQTVGPVFEHSPWIADEAWSRRPFTNVPQLHHALCDIVRAAAEPRQVDLIRAHPDLAGRAALTGSLTAQSAGEQAGAGLDRLNEAELEAFRTSNDAYRRKFGFPFVICARLNKKEVMLQGFKRRLENSRNQEVQTALEEIFKIADLRLRDLIAD
jgi:2-oxo-4-hydroxy-4-carboxy-5-ureidoimidazoline decarboxylase